MKRCSRCKEEKPLGSFYTKSSSKDGKQSECASCHDLMNQSWRERNREKSRRYNKAFRLRNLLAAIERLGGSCAWCGNDDWRVLQFDHVNDDGYLEKGRRGAIRTEVRRGRRDDIQLLCANCHQLKSWRMGSVEIDSDTSGLDDIRVRR